MLLPEEKLHLIAYLVATWFLALASFGVGRVTAEPVVTKYETKLVESDCEVASTTEPPTCEVPEVAERETLDQLVQRGAWDEAIDRCKAIDDRWSTECESIDLRLVRGLSAGEELGSRLAAIDYLNDRGLPFAEAHPRTSDAPNLAFTHDETLEVVEWCALARQTQPEACLGLEWVLAMGLFTAGEVNDLPEAYSRMRRIGVQPFRERRMTFYTQAKSAYSDKRYKRALFACEHGIEHGDERCITLLALAHNKLGDRRTACEIFTGVPDADLPFRCGRSLVTKQVVDKQKMAYETESRSEQRQLKKDKPTISIYRPPAK